MYIDDITQYMIYALKTKGKHFSPPKQIRNKRPVSTFLPDLRLNFNPRKTGKLHQTGHCYRFVNLVVLLAMWSHAQGGAAGPLQGNFF